MFEPSAEYSTRAANVTLNNEEEMLEVIQFFEREQYIRHRGYNFYFVMARVTRDWYEN